MLIIPAIDLLGGACVRLVRGDYLSPTVYSRDPVQVAQSFERAGARRIHIVDLDAARGKGDNRNAIRRVRGAVSCTLEVGGGVRSEEDVRELRAIGVERIVIGTALVKQPHEVERWAKVHDCLIAGIDALDGRVRIAGWEQESELTDLAVARAAARIGVRAIIYTDISKDGTLSGPAIDRTVRVAAESHLPVILSGGISGPADFDAACGREGIVGVITGKALYEGRIDLGEIIRRHQTEQQGDVAW